MKLFTFCFIIVFIYGCVAVFRDFKKLIKKLLKNSKSQAKKTKNGGENIEDDY